LKRVFGLLTIIAILLLLVVLVRTFTWSSRQIQVAPVKLKIVDASIAADRLAQAVRFQTLSNAVPVLFDPEPFRHFHAFLAASYPNAHAAMRLEKINEFTLLFEWPGTDPSLAPLLLQAHQDVVPADATGWEQPPFDGVIADGFIWGRGTLDIKTNLLGILEAIEKLSGEGRKPERTILLSFGHDEEIGGPRGAKAVAERLRTEGRRIWAIVDEGLCIVDGVVPGVKAPVALIGIAEKGYLTLEISAVGKGGHSAIPPRQTATGIVAAALAKIEASPMPGELQGTVRRTFEYVGPEMDLPLRALFANMWLFSPLIVRELSGDPATNAVLRTTTAVTVMEGSQKDNVLPTLARGAVNFRLRPGDTAEDVIAHVRRAINDDRVKIEISPSGAREASPVSDIDSDSYRALERTIRQIFPEAVVAPTIDTGGTDSKHFTDLAENIFRFNPVVMTEDDLPRLHGLNERIAIDAHARAVDFYYQFFLNSSFSQSSPQ